MKTSLLLALMLLQLPAAAPPSPAVPSPALPSPALPSQVSFARYMRSIRVSEAGQACAILDATTLTHAAPFLKDLRLYSNDPSGLHEVPFVLTLSEAQQAESEPARILNLGIRGHAIDFDLAMPNRPYTEVVLDLAGQDFLATATVSGVDAPGFPRSTRLGDFNLFDLTSQHLSRSTSLHLQESTFPFLHITLTASPAGREAFAATPQMIRAASVPPSREAQTLFTAAAETATLEARGNRTIARFHVPERIPIERVLFELDPHFGANFSRDVLISARAPGSPAETSADSVTGTIQRVRLNHAGRDISEQQLGVPATLGANLQQPADVEVAVINGDDPPLPIASVSLEMRQHDLCFHAAAPAGQFTLFYGDPGLSAPVYDLSRTYKPAAHSAAAHLGPEQQNPAFHDRPDTRPYTERHPHLLWVALLVVVGSLAFVAFHHPRTRLH